MSDPVLVQGGHRWGWDGVHSGRLGEVDERRVGPQDSPGVPTVADGERESRGGQAGAVLRGRCEQEDPSIKSAGQGKGPRASVGPGGGVRKGPFPPHPLRWDLEPEGVLSPLPEENGDSNIESCRGPGGTGGGGSCGPSGWGANCLGLVPCVL